LSDGRTPTLDDLRERLLLLVSLGQEALEMLEAGDLSGVIEAGDTLAEVADDVADYAIQLRVQALPVEAG